MNDAEFEIAQRSVLLMEKARATVKRAVASIDRPGHRWYLNELGYPKFNSTRKAAIYTNDDGTAYEVHIYTYAGEEVTRVIRKTLTAAFKVGETLADKAAA